jgi:hypothetical protein
MAARGRQKNEGQKNREIDALANELCQHLPKYSLHFFALHFFAILSLNGHQSAASNQPGSRLSVLPKLSTVGVRLCYYLGHSPGGPAPRIL